MPEVRAPGVYFEPAEQRVPPLSLAPSGVPIFLGVTRRGPLDRPVRIHNRARFTEVFGEWVSGSYLGAAVRGFFDNGGESCFVLRVARVSGEEGEERATAASLELLDRGGAPTLRVSAQDAGTWGNHIRVTLQAHDEVRTILTRDAMAGERSLQVKSTHGLAAGTRVRLYDGENEQWTVVQAVDRKSVSLRHPLIYDFASAAPSYLGAHDFSLTVADLDRSETFAHVALNGASPRYVERVVAEQSRLVRIVALRPRTDPGQARPMEVSSVALQGGADGLDDLGPDDFIGHDRGPGDRRGLTGLITHEQGDLLVMPDLMWAYQRSQRFRSLRDVEAVQDAAITVCERSGMRVALLDPPPDVDFQETLRWRRQFDSPYAALYFPWLVVLDGGRRRSVPPCGHVAGVIARSDKEYGVHKAPANEVVEGIVDLDILLQDAHLAMLNEAGINCTRAFGARGLRIWGARTCSSNPEWRYLNVRRVVSSIAAAIEAGTQWAVFESNGPGLWKRVSRLVVAFLATLRERGMLVGDTPEDAFFVQCDAETNPPGDVDRGMLVSRIGIAVTRPVEFIVFRLSQRLEDQAQSDEE